MVHRRTRPLEKEGISNMRTLISLACLLILAGLPAAGAQGLGVKGGLSYGNVSNRGVLPGTGGTQRLTRIVGKPRAIEMMAKGETFSFEKAKELGLVTEVFPAADYWDQAMLYARQFCPPHKAAKAVGLIKRAVQSGAEVPFESALALERELQQQLFQSEDAKEGIAAYVEKRVAEFKGR